VTQNNRARTGPPERSAATTLNPGAARLADAAGGAVPWRDWGPYLSERAWGTVLEDNSADGDARNATAGRIIAAERLEENSL